MKFAAGTVLSTDEDFELARKEDVTVEARQGHLRIWGPGPVEACGMLTVTLKGRRLLRSANEFIVIKSK